MIKPEMVPPSASSVYGHALLLNLNWLLCVWMCQSRFTMQNIMHRRKILHLSLALFLFGVPHYGHRDFHFFSKVQKHGHIFDLNF